MNFLRSLYYRLFPTYRRVELVFVEYALADAVLKELGHGHCSTHYKGHWRIAHDVEHRNFVPGWVWLEYVQRVR